MALLVRKDTRQHFPRVEIDIILEKSVEAVVARNLKFWSHPQLGSSLLCTLDRFDDSGSISLLRTFRSQYCFFKVENWVAKQISGVEKISVLPEHVLRHKFSARKDHLQNVRTPVKRPLVQAADAKKYQYTFLDLTAWIHLTRQ